MYSQSYYVILLYTRMLKVKRIPDSTDRNSLIFLHVFNVIRQVCTVRLNLQAVNVCHCKLQHFLLSIMNFVWSFGLFFRNCIVSLTPSFLEKTFDRHVLRYHFVMFLEYFKPLRSHHSLGMSIHVYMFIIYFYFWACLSFNSYQYLRWLYFIYLVNS